MTIVATVDLVSRLCIFFLRKSKPILLNKANLIMYIIGVGMMFLAMITAFIWEKNSVSIALASVSASINITLIVIALADN